MKYTQIFKIVVSILLANTRNMICSYRIHEKKLLQTIHSLNRDQQKGILAMDESIPTMGKRFLTYNIKNNKYNRNKYRKILLQTPHLNKYISGCILYEETVNEKSTIPNLVKRKIIPGIKLDEGLISMNCMEFTTKGISSLEKKCKKYSKMGIRFAKWRAVFRISLENKYPSLECIIQNCKLLAEYASICQRNSIVPMIEPEIIMDGNHSIYDTAKVQETILKYLFHIFDEYNILLEATILKTNMVCPAKDCPLQTYPNEVANMTIRTFERAVPASLPMIALLSGGLSENMASLYLQNIREKMKKAKAKWNITFSFGRALQTSCLKTWKNKDENTNKVQKKLVEKLIQNTQANAIIRI